ncbi:Fic family protein [Patescibacteria group bacterium]|nr:Fic family protein [Patescibacteria group bacterium]MCG2702007.1 Fic family protein [Candidatus Parcubacteria bacterium]MBU4210801.1 Fic family protein [Patescibacteria group bacterium]MBU4264822.1 Fic family protein [Patescibacteria group bacterium]MBU4389844.1 Fic family protein [Patescibacteria group bacterium]
MKTFIPQELPLKEIKWEENIDLIIKANTSLARYDELLKTLQNPTLFLTPLMKKEAVLSSRIEGTQATVEDILRHEADINSVIETEDMQEVLNYRDAMLYSTQYLKKRPVCLNLIKEIHKILLKKVRGQNKNRGQFRQRQVWIGARGTKLEEAEFIPPAWEKINGFLSNWEKYIHYRDKDLIVQLAVIHAQFEIIHPFLDGNGRVGRIILPLFLYQKGILSTPMFYLSEYLEKHRNSYYQNLLNISKKNDWNSWIKFFLKTVNSQAKDNIEKIYSIKALYEKTKEQLLQLRSPYSIKAIDALFNFPFFSSTRFAKFSKINNRVTAINLIKKMQSLNIIKIIKKKKGSKPAIYLFPELLTLLK